MFLRQKRSNYELTDGSKYTYTMTQTCHVTQIDKEICQMAECPDLFSV